MPPVNGNPAPVDTKTFYGFTDDRTIQDVQTVSARIEHHVNDNLTLRNQTQYSHYRTDARATNAASVLTGPLSTLDGAHERQLHDAAAVATVRAAAGQGPQSSTITRSTTRPISKRKFETGFVKHDVIARRRPEPRHVQQPELHVDRARACRRTRSRSCRCSIRRTRRARQPRRHVATNLAESSANGIGIYANDTVSLSD